MASPVEVKELPKDCDQLVRKLYKGHPEGFCQLGPQRYIMPSSYAEHADDVRGMPVLPGDVWVCSYPRSGTTWTQELVWLVKNDLDYKTAAEIYLTHRYVFIDIFPFMHEQKSELEAAGLGALCTPGHQLAAQMPTPRFVKTHMPLSLLPPSLLDNSKVVYVARDPRDAAVSFYYHNMSFTCINFTGDFKSYWDLFHKDLVPWTPYWAHVKEAWAQRRHPNMLFLFYEDMIKDLPSTIKLVSDFFGKQYSEEQILRLCDHLDFKNFKQNVSVNLDYLKHPLFLKEDAAFVRKGKAGGWREHFDEPMRRQAQEWIEKNLADTDLRFPTI